ncbi:MAG: efflux RND transporter periplasmic adaptor subunit, partial [Sphingomicrobium sp.]
MNMLSHVAVDGEIQTLREKIASRPKWQRAAIAGTPLVLLAAAVTYWNSGPSPAAAPPLPRVTVAAPLERQVNQWDDYVGRFEASRSVEVRPRISGQVVGVHFTDGQIVQKGQLLFTIDPRPFAAALAEARAGVATAQSDLSLAQINLGRARRLLEAEAVSQADVDRLTANVRSAQAALAAAQARVRSRALDVEFTQVRAPIGGRISDRKIDAGNLVGANETLLTTINALDPIYFTFDGSEALFLKTQRARQPGAAPAAVEIRLQDEAEHRWK